MKFAVIALVLASGSAGSALASAACPMPADAGATVRYVSFFDGDPKDMVELAPDDESSEGRLDLTWQFAPARPRPITMVCNYSNADTLRADLSEGVSLCKLTGEIDAGGNVVGTPVLVCQ